MNDRGPMKLIAFDVTLRRPGCALIAAAMGTDTSIPARYFDSGTWLNAPTPDMHAYLIPEKDLEQLAATVNAERAA